MKEWSGVVDDVAFVLSVAHCENGIFSGVVSYPSLGAARLRISGKIKYVVVNYILNLFFKKKTNKQTNNCTYQSGYVLEYVEDQCLFNEEFVAVGSVYKLKFSSSSVAEGVCTSLDNSVSKVVLRLVRPPLRLQVKPHVWKGFVMQPVPCELQIGNVSSSNIASGSFLLNGSITKFSAPIVGRQLNVNNMTVYFDQLDFVSGVVLDSTDPSKNKLFFLRE